MPLKDVQKHYGEGGQVGDILKGIEEVKQVYDKNKGKKFGLDQSLGDIAKNYQGLSDDIDNYTNDNKNKEEVASANDNHPVPPRNILADIEKAQGDYNQTKSAIDNANNLSDIYNAVKDGADKFNENKGNVQSYTDAVDEYNAQKEAKKQFLAKKAESLENSVADKVNDVANDEQRQTKQDVALDDTKESDIKSELAFNAGPELTGLDVDLSPISIGVPDEIVPDSNVTENVVYPDLLDTNYLSSSVLLNKKELQEIDGYSLDNNPYNPTGQIISAPGEEPGVMVKIGHSIDMFNSSAPVRGVYRTVGKAANVSEEFMKYSSNTVIGKGVSKVINSYQSSMENAPETALKQGLILEYALLKTGQHLGKAINKAKTFAADRVDNYAKNRLGYNKEERKGVAVFVGATTEIIQSTVTKRVGYRSPDSMVKEDFVYPLLDKKVLYKNELKAIKALDEVSSHLQDNRSKQDEGRK